MTRAMILSNACNSCTFDGSTIVPQQQGMHKAARKARSRETDCAQRNGSGVGGGVGGGMGGGIAAAAAVPRNCTCGV